MTKDTKCEFPQSEKVRILLAEHASLRTEIVARIGHAYQLMSVGSVSIAFLGGAHAPGEWYKFWLICAAILCFIGFGFWSYIRDVRKASARIREIELDVNERAKEDLLVWENLWGGEINGYFGRSACQPRSFISNCKPPNRTFKGKPIQASQLAAT